MSTRSHALIAHPHVDLRDGSPVVCGTRVPVRRLWNWHRKGVTVETLVKRYPALGWAKILSSLSFAYDNEALVEADNERERALLKGEPDLIPGRMVQMDLLEQPAGLNADIRLSEEGMNALVKLCENPPAPTQALRAARSAAMAHSLDKVREARNEVLRSLNRAELRLLRVRTEKDIELTPETRDETLALIDRVLQDKS